MKCVFISLCCAGEQLLRPHGEELRLRRRAEALQDEKSAVFAMSMRATLFPKKGSKHNSDAIDFDNVHLGATTVSPVSIKRESCDFAIDVHDLQGGEIPGKSKDLDQNYMTSKVVLAAKVAEVVQGDNITLGILSPVRPMGGEGTPVKGKPLSVDNMDNLQMPLNNNPKEGGADESAKGVVPGVLGTASIELSSEGKWRNIRKTPANPHTQANCLRQILLLQLDLIEQQQQQLQSKDKEIDELKADKETVCSKCSEQTNVFKVLVF